MALRRTQSFIILLLVIATQARYLHETAGDAAAGLSRRQGPRYEH